MVAPRRSRALGVGRVVSIHLTPDAGDELHAVAEGIELCRPCADMTERLEREGRTGALTAPETLAHMDGRGGLRAAIVESGELRPGDAVGESVEG